MPKWLKHRGVLTIETIEDAENYIKSIHLKSCEKGRFGFLTEYERRGYGFDSAKAILQLVKKQSKSKR